MNDGGALDGSFWARVEEVFHEAVELEGGARGAYLEDACAGAPGVLAEVERLLAGEASSRGMTSALGAGIGSAAGESGVGEGEGVRAGDRIGAWRLVERIGAGGMGDVWLVERDDGAFSMRAALKLIKRGMDTEEILRRFRTERQVLAGLDHPGIARLVDGGAAPDGRPYLVLEHVDGQRIDAWCAAHAPGVDAKLRVVLGVCDAVQAAHQRLIVHRDIKPANVLVTNDGAPKLLDFGIAKLLGEDSGSVTVTGERVLTPRYASPEQVAGSAVTTATDVHALGVLLFELLTGASPFAGDNDSRRTVEEQIERGRRRRASDAAPTPAVRSRLRGDLDTILGKAMDVEASRRYATPGALAEDIRRHLAHEPVLAQAPGRVYTFGKFVRRNRVASVAGAVALLAVIAGGIALGAGYVQAQRGLRDARLGRDEADGVTAFLLDALLAADPLMEGRPDVPVREVLDRTSAEVGASFGDRPLVEARVRDAMGRTYSGIGLQEEASVQLERALALREEMLGVSHEATATTALALARLRFAQDRLDEADELVLDVIESGTAARGADDATVLGALVLRGVVRTHQSRLEEALEVLERAVADHERVFGAGAPETVTAVSELARVHWAAGRNEDAKPLFARVVAAREERFGPEHPLTLRAVNDLANAHWRLGELQEALALHRRVHDRHVEMLGVEHPETLIAKGNLSNLLIQTGAPEEALPLLTEQLSVSERTLGPEHRDTQIARNNFAWAYYELERFEEALPLFETNYEMSVRLHGPEHSAAIDSAANLGPLYEKVGRYEEAEAIYAHVLDVCERLYPDDFTRISTSSNLAKLHLVRERFADAVAAYERTMALVDEKLGPDHFARGVVLSGYGRALLGVGRVEEAREALLEARRQLVKDVGEDNRRVAEVDEALEEVSEARRLGGT